MFGHFEGFLILLFVCFHWKWRISTVNQDGFKPNLESHLIPLLATNLESSSGENKDKNNMPSARGTAHHPLLMQVNQSLG